MLRTLLEHDYWGSLDFEDPQNVVKECAAVLSNPLLAS